MAKVKDKRSFEDMLGELIEIVETLERGDLSLEDMLTHYQAGRALVRSCDDRLRAAEKQLNGEAKKRDKGQEKEEEKEEEKEQEMENEGGEEQI